MKTTVVSMTVTVRVHKEEGITVVVGLLLVLSAWLVGKDVDTIEEIKVLGAIDVNIAAVFGSELSDVVEVVEALEEVSWYQQAFLPTIGQGPKLVASVWPSSKNIVMALIMSRRNDHIQQRHVL
jgi:hypothetical protein